MSPQLQGQGATAVPVCTGPKSTRKRPSARRGAVAVLGMPKNYVMGALAALLALIVVCLLKSVCCGKCVLLFVPPSALALY